MNDARIERKRSLQKKRKSNGQGSKSSSQKKSGHKAPVSDTAACDSQEAASCSHSNIAGKRKVDSQAPFHSPPLHAASQSALPEPRPSQLPPSSQLNCEVKEAKSSLSQIKEEASTKTAAKYPKDCDAFGEKEPDDRQSSLKSKNAPDLCKETPVKDAEGSDRECMNKNIDQADGKNNLTKNGEANILKNGSRDDEQGTTVPLNKPLVQNEPVIKKGTRQVPFAHKKLKRAKGKESSKPKEGCHSDICASVAKRSVNDGGLQGGTVMSETQHIQDNDNDSDGLSSGETRSIPSVEASPSNKETPVQQEQSSLKTANLDTSALSQAHSITLVEPSSKKETPFNQEEHAPDTTDPEASTPREAVGSQTVVHNAVPEESVVPWERESANPFKKNQRQNEVFILLLLSIKSLVISLPKKG